MNFRLFNICIVLLWCIFLVSCQESISDTSHSNEPAVSENATLDLGRVERSNQNTNPLDSSVSHESVPPNAVQEEELPNEPVVQTASIAAIGDVLIHRSIYADAWNGETYDFDPMFEQVKPYLSETDITFANQESMVGGAEIGLSDYPRFNSPFEIADTLKRVGVDVVSLANNHTLDRGEEAIRRAIEHWDQLGIVTVGASLSEEEQRRVRTIERNGIRFAFLAYTYGTNGIPIPKGKAYLVDLIDRERISNDIARAREVADVIVVSLHFGVEYVRMPTDEQREWVQFVADEGAHIILGHHPHVLQPVEAIESAQGHMAFAIYSLGNFIAAQDKLYRRIGGILQLDVERIATDESVEVNILNPRFLVTYIQFKNWRDYSVVPMMQVSESQLSNASEHYAEMKEHMAQYVPELTFIEHFDSWSNEK